MSASGDKIVSTKEVDEMTSITVEKTSIQYSSNWGTASCSATKTGESYKGGAIIAGVNAFNTIN